MVAGESSPLTGAEQRLKELGIRLPSPPQPFGTYVEAVQTGNLLFLTGMLPTEGREAKFIGHLGKELDIEAGRKAAYLATLNVLAVARQHLGSLDKVTRIVRLGVSIATSKMFAIIRKLLTLLPSYYKTSSKREESLSPGLWRRKPSARNPSRAGSYFRGSRRNSVNVVKQENRP